MASPAINVPGDDQVVMHHRLRQLHFARLNRSLCPLQPFPATQPQEQAYLEQWLQENQVDPDLDGLNVTEAESKALLDSVKGMKVAATNGLDQWPVQPLKVLNSKSAHALILLHGICEHAALWPYGIRYVRTQIIPLGDSHA